MEKLNSEKGQRSSPTVYADDGSVVTARVITKAKKNISYDIVTGGDPGPGQTGNAAGQFPQADCIATGGSVVCMDTISDAEGDINFSVNTSRGGAGRAAGTPSSSQGPAVKKIKQHKVELINCLMADHSFILQHAHGKEIITERQYWKLKHISSPEENVTNLIDEVIVNGQDSCSLFLQVLKEPFVLKTYPRLNEITKQCC